MEKFVNSPMCTQFIFAKIQNSTILENGIFFLWLLVSAVIDQTLALTGSFNVSVIAP